MRIPHISKDKMLATSARYMCLPNHTFLTIKTTTKLTSTQKALIFIKCTLKYKINNLLTDDILDINFIQLGSMASSII